MQKEAHRLARGCSVCVADHTEGDQQLADHLGCHGAGSRVLQSIFFHENQARKAGIYNIRPSLQRAIFATADQRVSQQGKCKGRDALEGDIGRKGAEGERVGEGLLCRREERSLGKMPHPGIPRKRLLLWPADGDVRHIPLGALGRRLRSVEKVF